MVEVHPRLGVLRRRHRRDGVLRSNPHG
jgi:hypothetical protein